MRFYLTTLIFLVNSWSFALSEDLPALERWDRAVCLHTPSGRAPEADYYASAFLVEHQDTLYLVTAAHAAHQTQRTSRLRFRSRDGKSHWVTLATLFPTPGDPWTRHKHSDVATAAITNAVEAKPYRDLLSEIAIPYECLKTEAIPRTTVIEVAGFPLGFGADERNVRPLVAMTHVSSDELDAKNQWGTEPILYTFPAVAQGTSGGPAFRANDDLTECEVAGMYIGVAADISGGKLSKLVPARVIRDALQ